MLNLVLDVTICFHMHAPVDGRKYHNVMYTPRLDQVTSMRPSMVDVFPKRGCVFEDSTPRQK